VTDVKGAPIMPRGLRNNNPGNLRAGCLWIGYVGADPDGYAQFDTLEHGVRALTRDLLTKMRRGLVTIRDIITTYAPATENPTQSYIAFVSHRLQVLPNETITSAYIPELVDAITFFECGEPLSVDVLASGVESAHHR
jgi:hypothetical protein